MGFETGTFTLSHLVPGCTGGERKGAGIEGMGGAMRKGADWLFVLQLYGYSPYVHDTEQKSIPEQSGHYLALKMRRKKDERWRVEKREWEEGRGRDPERERLSLFQVERLQSGVEYEIGPPRLQC